MITHNIPLFSGTPRYFHQHTSRSPALNYPYLKQIFTLIHINLASFFVGHMQTVQTQIGSDQYLHYLLTECLIKI